MPHRLRLSLAAESLKLDSWLSRHALARPPKGKMQHLEAQKGASVSRTLATASQPHVRESDDTDSRTSSLILSFERALSLEARLRRPPAALRGLPSLFAPAPRQPYFLVPRPLPGRAFHTTRCYSPQFPNERHLVLRPEMATGVKRSWKDDVQEGCRPEYVPALEFKRQNRSRSCDGLDRSYQHRPTLSEEELRADVRRLRKWEHTGFGREHWLAPRAGTEFTVVTYNVLAQCLLEDNGYLYQHCDPQVLPWDFRKGRILRELTEANADILCLQEIQSDHYEDFFVPQLGKLGYAGRYKKRTGNKSDGCAIFFKDEAFELDGCTSVEYCKPGLDRVDRDRDNIALLALLRPRRGGAGRGRLCVANTHLLFNPGRGDIKLAQLRILLAEIDRLAYRHPPQQQQQPYHPVILCGDLNSEPHCSLYEFVSTGALRYEGLVAGDISGQAEGYRKGRFCLDKELVPEQLGISDQCQYVDAARQRRTVVQDPVSSGRTMVQDPASSGRTIVQDPAGSGRTIVQDPASSGRTMVQDPASSGRTIVQDPASSGRTIVQDLVSSGRTIVQDLVNSGRTIVQDPASSGRTIVRDSASSGRTIVQDPASSGRTMVQESVSAGSAIVQDHANSGRTIVQDPVSAGRTMVQDPASSGRTSIQESSSFGEKDRPRMTSVWQIQNLANSEEPRTADDVRAKQGSARELPASSGSKDDAPFSTGEMTHGLNLVSAYGHGLNRTRGSRAAVTTHHRKGSCMVDYIFYSVRSKDSRIREVDSGRLVEHRHRRDGQLSLIATYGLLSCEELTRLGGLPNGALASDHLALAARFLLREDS